MFITRKQGHVLLRVNKASVNEVDVYLLLILASSSWLSLKFLITMSLPQMNEFDNICQTA